MQWLDKVVWITGASDGIGAALAKVLAREGARLILTARRREALEDVALSCAPAQVRILPADLMKLDELEALAAQAESLFGSIDVLVNNAGISQRATALQTELPVVQDIMALNFFAPVALTRAVLPAMIERGSGVVSVTSSLAGHVGTPLRSTYSASKHAVQGWFDSLRAELHGTGVAVTIVSPGYIQTDIAVRARTADGSLNGKRGVGNMKGLSAEVCAERMASALAKGRREVFIAGPEVMGVYLKRWVPGLVARYVHRAAPRDES
ncbi:MAG: SDR family oxidoreductase [Deltaproteobacteria bacterium]|nr:MAG: SDR family oxidoreductase [Deltaproteobacteria bacterium]